MTGKWHSNDLIGISGGLNQYVFCGDNPVNRVDPFGLEDLDLELIRRHIRGVQGSIDYIVETMASNEYSLYEYEVGKKQRGIVTIGYGGEGAINRANRPDYINRAIDKTESWKYMPGRIGMFLTGAFAAAMNVATFQGTEEAARDWLTMHLLSEWGVHVMYLAELQKLEQQALQQQKPPTNPYTETCK